MRVIYEEIAENHLSDKALDIINNIAKKSKRHQLKEYYNNTLDVYYSDIGEISHFVKTKDVDIGIKLTISKVFV